MISSKLQFKFFTLLFTFIIVITPSSCSSHCNNIIFEDPSGNEIDIYIKSRGEYLEPTSTKVFQSHLKYGKWKVFTTKHDISLNMFAVHTDRGYKFLTFQNNKLKLTRPQKNINHDNCNNIFNTNGNKLLHHSTTKYIYCNGDKHSCVDGKDAKCVLTGKKYDKFC